jgi:hypothetical protein
MMQLVALLAISVLGMPLIFFASANHLFGLSLGYTFWNWLAYWGLVFALSRVVEVRK